MTEKLESTAELPWSVDCGDVTKIRDARGHALATISHVYHGELRTIATSEANAAHIVKCCNGYRKLEEELARTKVFLSTQNAAAHVHMDVGAALDIAWESINALGGYVAPKDERGHGFSEAIGAALHVIEKLGGKDPASARAVLSDLGEGK